MMKYGTAASGRFTAACFLFACSGALGLGYELVWIRKAALVVGASPAALATVLTAFFLGLGAGGYVVGRLRRGRRSPLFVYGLFEVAIGAYALAFPFLFDGMEACYGALYPVAAGSSALLLALRFCLLFALFLPATFLMGGTLPLLLDGLVADDASVAARTSALYACNILGAVAGVLVTCYAAIPHLGMNGTSRVGGLGNLALGLVALVWFRRTAPLHTAAPAPPPASGRESLALLTLAFLAGLVAIGLQVVWARYFSLLEVTSIYTTAMLLAVFLLGLSLGSLALGSAARRGLAPLRVLAVAQLLLPVVVILTLRLWRAFDLVHRTEATLENGLPTPLPSQSVVSTWTIWSESVDNVFFAPLFKVSAVVLLPVLLVGVAVPALIAAAAKSAPALRSRSGAILLANTVGSAAGACLTGYALVPLLGMHRTLAVLGILSLATAALAAGCGRSTAPLLGTRTGRWLGVVAAASTAVVIAFATVVPDVTRETILHDGLGRNLGHGPVARQLGLKPARLVEVVEGPLDTCFLFEDDHTLQLGSGCVSLASVAKEGVSGQAVQGHLPVIFFPGASDPRRCLGICLGSGQSFGALLLHGIERLDVVDISASVVDLSLRRFAAFNHGLGSDPRVALHLDDGRHFVERAPDQGFDVVSMEPPPPAADGVHSLYSVEFYREVRRVLTADGVLMQWLPVYRITPMDAQNIVKTLAAVFPETFVVFKGNQDLMTLSYVRRPTFSVAAMRRRCAVVATERNIAGARFAAGCRHDLASFEGMLAALMAGPTEVQHLPAVAVYEDDTQLLSYGTGDRHLLHRYRGNQLGQVSFAALPESAVASFADYFDPPLTHEQVVDAIFERTAAMAVFNPPNLAVLRAYQESRQRGDAEHRRTAALQAAAEYDRALRKVQAFQLVGEALEASPAHATAADRDLVRAIVRNHFAVYVHLVRECVQALAGRFPAAPLVAAMQDEFATLWRGERARLDRYLFPGAPDLASRP